MIGLIKLSTYLLLLLSFSSIVIRCHSNDSIYLLNTEDGEHIEAFDCFDHQSQRYCRRPEHPITLQRDHSDKPCLGNGIRYYFDDLVDNQTLPSTILHRWRSTLEKVEDYNEYRHLNRTSFSNMTWLCHCVHPQSFGKHCEYQLPLQTTIQQIIANKFVNTKKKLNYEGDIVCYGTLSCNYGLLCLDWRDICDGKQQCMFGVDETNCEKIEFNECDEDEYRCMNGMCIPDEFFLDGDYDCMDMTDENKRFDYSSCPFREATFECDDRVIDRDEWSCGDGQQARRVPFNGIFVNHRCWNRRDQFFWCESVDTEVLWTLPNGRCTHELSYNKNNLSECCNYWKICASLRKNRAECKDVNKNCGNSSENNCKTTPKYYPQGALMLPFVFGAHSLLRASDYDVWEMRGQVKCIRGNISFVRSFNARRIESTLYYFWQNYQDVLCPNNIHYQQDCLGRSTIFNNRSVYFKTTYTHRSTCFSPYHTKYSACCPDISAINGTSYNNFTNQICRRLYKYRFQCSSEQPTCLPINKVGNDELNCKNNHDESWLDVGYRLSKLACTSSSKYNCQILRKYLESSWNPTERTHSHFTNLLTSKLPFPFYCDTFNDIPDGFDEINCEDWICSPQKWQCANGQCIHKIWLLDDRWDCSDASDEENFFSPRFSEHNQSADHFDDKYTGQFIHKYPEGSLWIDCSLVNLSSCFPSSTFIPSQHREVCFNTTSSENQYLDFPALCDEQSVADFCSHSLRKLNYSFECLSIKSCLRYWQQLINNRNATCACLRGGDTDVCGSSSFFRCWDGTSTNRRCNGIRDCQHGEDEFLCPDIMDLTNRTERKRLVRAEILEQIFFDLEPDELSPATSSRISSPSLSTNSTLTFNLLNDLTTLNRCNRGLAIRFNNSYDVCFCPPQYHGDQCQWHSDRLTLFFAVNLTHSNYGNKIIAENIVIKYLILLFFDDKVIDSDEVHIRSIDHLVQMTKIRVYLHYSRSLNFIQHRQHRFLNQSNLIHDHPYRIRIEAFEMKVGLIPLRMAVWQYSLDFDYLPVHRVAKILRFVDSHNNNITDPCHLKPCQLMKNAECFRVQNQPSEHLCLCLNGYSGLNCTDRSQLCLDNYCSSQSLCQPGYSALMYGNIDKPYCICPLNSIGRRCHMTSDICAHYSCHNGGTCFQGSSPDHAQCLCRQEFTGNTCEIHLAISDYTSVTNRVLEKELFVVQSFMIDPFVLLMTEVHRQLYRYSSGPFNYQRSDLSNIELLVLRIYTVSEERIHLLSILRTTDLSVPHTPPTDSNRCQNMKSTNYTVTQYHRYCHGYPSARCFYDYEYFCLCQKRSRNAECFAYDHKHGDCNRCYANGRCIQGAEGTFKCLCQPCYFGTECQLNFEAFSFTVDQLFLFDLLSKNPFVRSISFFSITIIPFLLFIFGLPTNIFTFVTFRRHQCRRNGVGEYLFFMSIINQTNLFCLLLCAIHMMISIFIPYKALILDTIFCKSLNYLLNSSTRLNYWLIALVSIERFYVVVFISGQWLKKPEIARRIILGLIVFVVIISSYEPVFFKALISYDHEEQPMCALKIPVSLVGWKTWHEIVSVFHNVTPFFINLFCTVGIIYRVTKQKLVNKMKDKSKIPMNTSGETIGSSSNSDGKQRLNFGLLKAVLNENKEYILAPTFTLIPQLFLLPFFIAAFQMRCQDFQIMNIRYLLIVSYFMGFVPSFTTFHLYISPSSFHRKEWQQTNVAQWFRNVRTQHPIMSIITKWIYIDE